MLIDRQACKPKNGELGHKGRSLGNVTYFYNFGTPSISPEWLKLGTSNLVYALSARPANQRNAKVGHKGRGLRYVAYFYNFGTCSIALERVN